MCPLRKSVGNRHVFISSSGIVTPENKTIPPEEFPKFASICSHIIYVNKERLIIASQSPGFLVMFCIVQEHFELGAVADERHGTVRIAKLIVSVKIIKFLRRIIFG